MKYADLNKYIEKNNLLTNIKKEPGIYAITIDDVVVYIGQSKDIYQRLSQHIYNIENAILSGEHKYLLLLAAKIGGHNIGFKELEYCKENILTTKEGEWIINCNPCLNSHTPTGFHNIHDMKIDDLLNDIKGKSR